VSLFYLSQAPRYFFHLLEDLARADHLFHGVVIDVKGAVDVEEVDMTPYDLECVFMYPWAVHYRKLGLFGFLEMLIFMVILFVCYVYVWKKGALEWE